MAAIHNGTSRQEGVWGPVTATLDWCEVGLPLLQLVFKDPDRRQANYQFSRYIAEMANSLSNLYSIGLAIFGVVGAQNESLPTRYTIGNVVSLDFCLTRPLFLTFQSGIYLCRHRELCIPCNHAIPGPVSRRNPYDFGCELRLLHPVRH